MLNATYRIQKLARGARNISFNPQAIAEAENLKIIAIPDDKDFIENFAASTGMSGPKELLDSGTWKNDQFLTSHLSDIYRAMLLYREGGVYYDMDVISIQVRNWMLWA